MLDVRSNRTAYEISKLMRFYGIEFKAILMEELVWDVNVKQVKRVYMGPIEQLDSSSGFQSEGCRFDSVLGH